MAEKIDLHRLWYPCAECGDHRTLDDIEVISSKVGKWEGSEIVTGFLGSVAHHLLTGGTTSGFILST